MTWDVLSGGRNRELLACARAGIEAAATGKSLAVETGIPAEPYSGLFVTLWRHGELRGCMGEIQPQSGDLGCAIARVATSSAARDPRFPRVARDELQSIRVDISLLEEPEPCVMADLDPEVFGVIVGKGARRGVLLPGIEGVESAAEQVKIACKKAGISFAEDYTLERFRITKIAEGSGDS